MDLHQVYHLAYIHNVLSLTRDGRLSKHDMIYLIEDVAKFGNMIVTRPSSRATTEMADHLYHDITYVHQEMISKMDRMAENIEPCICLRHYIDKKVKEIERRIDHDREEELYQQYDYWLGKQVFVDEIYGDETDEERCQEDEEKTDSDE